MMSICIKYCVLEVNCYEFSLSNVKSDLNCVYYVIYLKCQLIKLGTVLKDVHKWNNVFSTYQCSWS